MFDLAERIWREVVRWHYHIPRAVYWVTYLVGAAAVGAALQVDSATGLSAAGFVALVGMQGLVRWAYETHPPAVVAVPRFAAPTPEDAGQVQRLILTALRDHASGDFRFLRVGETVGQEDLPFAARLRSRLRSPFLVYGEVRNLGGRASVFARLLGPSRTGVLHVDTFTEDVTPQRTLWNRLFQRLTPTHDPEQTEYPFDFTTEIDTLVRSVEGAFRLLLGQPQAAERLLKRVLEPVLHSASHAVDEVRLDLVEALERQGREAEALELLRERSAQPTASPEILRTLAAKLRFPVADEQSLAQAVGLLRRAAADRTDPKRDMSLYNLAYALAQGGNVDEAGRLIDDLLHSRSHYRKAWYVKRIKGLQHWTRANELVTQGSPTQARAEFRAAARWYTAAIRARPRLVGGSVTLVRVPFTNRVLRLPSRPHYLPVPPKMWAIAADARLRAGARWRARFCGLLELRGRSRAAARGRRAIHRRKWDAAIHHFGQSVTERGDSGDVLGLVACAVAEHALGHHEQEAGRFQRAQAIDPSAGDLFDLMRRGLGL
jgi:tetratricopeptide (TPR) repeat protein